MNLRKIFFITPLFFLAAGCGLYHDVKASANPILSPGIRGVEIGAKLDKSLADFDTILQQSKLTYSISEIKSLIDKKITIDSIITDYALLYYYPSEYKIKEEQIRIFDIIISYVMTNRKNISDNFGEYLYLSNYIDVSKENLMLNNEKYNNQLNNFREYTGLNSINTDVGSLFSGEDKTSGITLEYRSMKAEKANNDSSIRRQNLQNFLPNADLSADTSNDLVLNQTALVVSANFGFSFSDIFKRENYNKILELENKKIDENIPFEIFENRSLSNLIDKKLETLKSKIRILKDNVKTKTELLPDVYKRYFSKELDLYKLISRINDMIQTRLDLVDAQRQYFILKKRLEYGILDI